MKNLELYSIKYVECETLETCESIITHSKQKAESFAKYLSKKNDILYSQIVTYYYDNNKEYYRFSTLKNYYK